MRIFATAKTETCAVALQPATDGMRRRDYLDFTEALTQRIVLYEGQMAQLPPQAVPAHAARTVALKPVARRHCPNNSSAAYDVSATSVNINWRSPLTCARKSVLLYKVACC